MKNKLFSYIKIFLPILIIGCVLGAGGLNLYYNSEYDFYRVKVHTNPMDGNYLSCNNCHKIGNKEPEIALADELAKLHEFQQINIDDRTIMYAKQENSEYVAFANKFTELYKQYYGENSKTTRMRLLYVTTLERDLSAMLRQECPKYNVENYFWKWFHTDMSDNLLFEVKLRSGESYFLYTKFTESEKDFLR